MEYPDPSKLFDYIKKYVKIKCKSVNANSKDKYLFGWVYTIDPITKW